MRYFFYNSFTLGAGYRYAELKDNNISQTDMPVDIDCDFCNGGCQMVVRRTNTGTSVLILKGILYVNSDKRFDEQGRKVYINFAIQASEDEHKKLNNMFFAMIAEWKNLCKYLGEIVKIPYRNAYGYGVEQESLEKLLNYLSSYNTDDIKSKMGVDKDDLNAIVLKSSDFSYYESLAKSFVNNNPDFFISFVKRNIISGESFAKLISELPVCAYDKFMQMIENCNVEDSVEDGFFDPETINDSNLVKKDDEIQTGLDKVHQSVNDCSDNEIKDVVKLDNEIQENVICQNLKNCKNIKPYYWSIIGLIIGLIIGVFIGYFIGK